MQVQRKGRGQLEVVFFKQKVGQDFQGVDVADDVNYVEALLDAVVGHFPQPLVRLSVVGSRFCSRGRNLVWFFTWCLIKELEDAVHQHVLFGIVVVDQVDIKEEDKRKTVYSTDL